MPWFPMVPRPIAGGAPEQPQGVPNLLMVTVRDAEGRIRELTHLATGMRARIARTHGPEGILMVDLHLSYPGQSFALHNHEAVEAWSRLLEAAGLHEPEELPTTRSSRKEIGL